MSGVISHEKRRCFSAVASHLQPKATHDSQIIQLNGAGNTKSMGIEYAS